MCLNDFLAQTQKTFKFCRNQVERRTLFRQHERSDEMSDNNERETVVVSNSSSNPLGVFVAIVLAAAVIFVGYLAYSGYFSGSESVSVELKVPEELTPSE